MSQRMLDLLRDLPAALGDLGHGDPDEPGRVLAADVVRWAAEEIARLRAERKPVVLMPLPFEPWRHGPISYRKCEMIAALKKAGVKWRPLPPGLEAAGAELPTD